MEVLSPLYVKSWALGDTGGHRQRPRINPQGQALLLAPGRLLLWITQPV